MSKLQMDRYVLARKRNAVRVDFWRALNHRLRSFQVRVCTPGWKSAVGQCGNNPYQSGGSMNKVVFALLGAATLTIPLGSSTSGSESNSVFSKKADWDSKGFEAYLLFRLPTKSNAFCL